MKVILKVKDVNRIVPRLLKEEKAKALAILLEKGRDCFGFESKMIRFKWSLPFFYYERTAYTDQEIRDMYLNSPSKLTFGGALVRSDFIEKTLRRFYLLKDISQLAKDSKAEEIIVSIKQYNLIYHGKIEN